MKTDLGRSPHGGECRWPPEPAVRLEWPGLHAVALALPTYCRARSGKCAHMTKGSLSAVQLNAASTSYIDCEDPTGFDVRL
jgi:hypothetical protein